MDTSWANDNINLVFVETAFLESCTEFLHGGHRCGVALPIAADAILAGHGFQ